MDIETPTARVNVAAGAVSDPGCSRPQAGAASRWAYTAIWVTAAALSLWVRTGFPIVALGGAGADDALFIRLARSLAMGQWLGPYDNLTLAKGMFYPLFIAAAELAAVPLKVAEQGVYLAVCLGVARYVSRQSGQRWLGAALFVLLAFNPVFWDRQLARVIREGLYISLSLAVVGLAVAVCLAPGHGRRAWLAVALGLVAGGFWLTREEGVWLLPALATVLLVALAAVARERNQGTVRRQRLVGLGASLAIAVAVFAAANGAVALLNGRFYGNAVTTEFKSRSFERAYGALAGIQQDRWRRYVVFPRDARERVYAVSPAARELSPFFEGLGGESWRRIGCEQSWIAGEACPEILAGWFMWALRDAAAAAGHAASARDARRFYQRLADEIDAACDAGSLACTASHRATLAPPFRWRYLGDAWKRSGTLFRIVATMGGGNLETPPSEGRQPELAAFADLGGPIAPVAGSMEQRLTGWVAATGGIPSLAVQAGPGVVATVQDVRSGRDIEDGFPGLKAMRFELVSNCRPGACDLIVAAPGAATVTLPWTQLAPGLVIGTPTERMYLETVSSFDLAATAAVRQRMQRWCAAMIYPLYGYGMPVLSALGSAGLAVAVLRRGLPLPLFALAAASVVAVACRIALLAYLDVTSIPSANSLYAAPASPFMILLAVLGVYAGFRALRTCNKVDAGMEKPLR